ncbi:unnamed protein product [Prunus armeniaca]|nr:unnamed protein product [Prunus armeniaca]
MANHDEEEEERKSERRGGAEEEEEEEEEGLRSEKQKRHADEQRTLDFSSTSIRPVAVYQVGTALNGIGIGAYRAQ